MRASIASLVCRVAGHDIVLRTHPAFPGFSSPACRRCGKGMVHQPLALPRGLFAHVDDPAEPVVPIALIKR